MIFVSVFSLWLGCFASYLSSSKQWLIYKPIPRALAWPGFVITAAIAITGLAMQFGWLVSMLISLLLTMAMWLLLVVVASHVRERSVLVFSLGTVVFPSIFLLGIN